MAVFGTRAIVADKGMYRVMRNTITALSDPNGLSADPLTDLILSGAGQLIERARAAELSALLAAFSTQTAPGASTGCSTWPSARARGHDRAWAGAMREFG